LVAQREEMMNETGPPGLPRVVYWLLKEHIFDLILGSCLEEQLPAREEPSHGADMERGLHGLAHCFHRSLEPQEMLHRPRHNGITLLAVVPRRPGLLLLLVDSVPQGEMQGCIGSLVCLMEGGFGLEQGL